LFTLETSEAAVGAKRRAEVKRGFLGQILETSGGRTRSGITGGGFQGKKAVFGSLSLKMAFLALTCKKKPGAQKLDRPGYLDGINYLKRITVEGRPPFGDFDFTVTISISSP
jgi:hypothetical protein